MLKKPCKTKNTWRSNLRLVWLNRLKPIWQQIEWPLIGILWALSLVLGYIGFRIHSETIGKESTNLDILYRVLQLSVFESGDVGGTVPLQIEIARIMMPAVTAYAAIKAILAIFREQWQILKIRLIKNHVVICGLGERGFRLTQDFLKHGYQVVAIEEDFKNPLIGQFREQGAFVLIGDARNCFILHKAGVKKAKYLIIVCTDDSTNVQIALKVREVVRLRKGGPITVFISIFDIELCKLLGGGELAASETYTFRLEFYNMVERGVRLILKDYSPLQYAVDKEDKKPHILLVGLNKLGISLLVQVAINWWMKYSNSGRRLKISIIDKGANAKLERLRFRYPQLDKVCEFKIWHIDNNSYEFERGEFLYDTKGNCDIGIIYICLDDDINAFISALKIHSITKQYKIPIILSMKLDIELSSLVNKYRTSVDFSQINLFSLLDRTCSAEGILGGMHEILAQSIHEDYVNHQKEAGETPKTNPSMVNWECLPEDLKESNRFLADHLIVKLNAISCGLSTFTNWETEFFKFLPEEIELLSELEHKRWCKERKYQGWSYAIGTKDIENKTSPYLVSWTQLPDDIKEYDRNIIRGMPSFLARAGFQIYRRLSSKNN